MTVAPPESEWLVIAASVLGSSHARIGMCCQDAHYSRALPDGVLIAAVADGAGSAALAEIGANIAARYAVETLAECREEWPQPEETQAWRELLIAALDQARMAIVAEADAQGAHPRALATTLILLVATPELTAVAQVGDGAVVARDTEGALHALTLPLNGEYVNETTFLISPDALEKAQVSLHHGALKHLALFSDGLQRLALKTSTGEPFPQFFTPLFRFASGATDAEVASEQLAAFLRSPRVMERTDDDLTLVLARLRE